MKNIKIPFYTQYTLSLLLALFLVGCKETTKSDEIDTSELNLSIEIESAYGFGSSQLYNAWSDGLRTVSISLQLSSEDTSLIELGENEYFTASTAEHKETKLGVIGDMMVAKDTFGAAGIQSQLGQSSLTLKFHRGSGENAVVDITLPAMVQTISPDTWLQTWDTTTPLYLSWEPESSSVESVRLTSAVGNCGSYEKQLDGVTYELTIPATSIVQSAQCDDNLDISLTLFEEKALGVVSQNAFNDVGVSIEQLFKLEVGELLF